jgi:hypothetical protein
MVWDPWAKESGLCCGDDSQCEAGNADEAVGIVDTPKIVLFWSAGAI